MPIKFYHPDTGEMLELDSNIELFGLLGQIKDRVCGHSDNEVRVRQQADGRPFIQRQCLRCGEGFGSGLKAKDFPNAEPFNPQLPASYKREIRIAEWAVATTYAAAKQKRETQFQRDYDSYIRSAEWQNKRSLIFHRCNGICEGCGQNKATDVHHITYENFKKEFLFELVGVCRDCHTRIHHQQDTEDEVEESPCWGCRFNAGDDCGIYDVPQSVALQDKDLCGPALKSLEPLK